jgi:AraC-like DNA-binding protein
MNSNTIASMRRAGPQNTDLSMAQLSDELGFQDANSFARLFKGEMGTTFNQFRSEKKG